MSAKLVRLEAWLAATYGGAISLDTAYRCTAVESYYIHTLRPLRNVRYNPPHPWIQDLLSK